MFVAAEPNGNNPNSGNPDMGEWFRTANVSNRFHDNKKFHNRCRIMLKGILNESDDERAFCQFRFMDLKATQGGASSTLKEIINYVNSNIHEVLRYFTSDDEEFGLAPHVIIVLGNNTQEVFEKTVRSELAVRATTMGYVNMPHPSAQTVVNEHLKKASSEINEKLVSISSKANRWFCKGRDNYGWCRVK